MIASNLADLFIKQANKNRSKVAIEYRLRRNEPYRTISWRHFNTQVMEIAYGLIELGLKKNNKIAILSNTRYEWAECDLAILSVGGVVVPIYPTLPDEAVNYILNNSECQIVIVEDKGQLQKIRSQWESLKFVKYAIVIEDLGDLPEYDNRIISFKRLKDSGKLNFSKDSHLIQRCLKEVNLDDVATIIYTSGTTGNPKGVMLTHGNILSVVTSLHEILSISGSDKFLSFLPLSHVFERVGGFFYSISTDATICYCSNTDQIASALRDSGATIMLVVPRLLEKIYAKVNSQLQKLSGFQKTVFEWAYSVGKENVLNRTLKRVSLLNLFNYMIADRLVFASMRRKLAPTLKCFISGGAPLSKEIGEFFSIIGMTILEGYGLTETAAPATVNTLKDFKLGTVGKPLPNVELKIAQDGEILIKGPTVFLGYYGNESATMEAFNNAWFSSGDIGVIDEDGFLKITDRKKDIIVNSSGKNIAPQNIENSIRTSKYISNVVVIGDRRKYLSALITLNHDAVYSFIEENKLSHYKEMEKLVKDSKIIELVDEEIKFTTADFADYEQIRRFTILPNDFTIESGEITPTLKVKRKYVCQKYKDLIDAMYPTD